MHCSLLKHVGQGVRAAVSWAVLLCIACVRYAVIDMPAPPSSLRQEVRHHCPKGAAQTADLIGHPIFAQV